jgi:predicted acylesterase/phospholipase RssA
MFSEALFRPQSEHPVSPLSAKFRGQERLRDAILAAAHKNIAGIETPELYVAHLGTKQLIEEFIASLTGAIAQYGGQALGEQRSGSRVTDADMMHAQMTLEFFQRLRRSYGRVALCLSGGASFGNFHWGLLRALFDRGELPSVISGCSAGALAAAFVCTRTDEEIRQDLHPENLHGLMQGLFDESFATLFRRFRARRGLLDSERVFAFISAMTKGSMTFLEAYNLTGRHLNISVQPSGKYRTTMVFNHLTSPDVIIASSIMASAAIPGMMDRPVTILKKSPFTQEITAYQAGMTWSDGSFQGDVPLQTLRELFSCSYFIVSQVNPHIVPFFYANKRFSGYSNLRGRTWRGGFLASVFEAFFKLEMEKNLKLIVELDLLPAFLGQNWNQLFLQEFEGQVTVVPSLSPKDYVRLISDPSLPEMKRYFRIGQLGMWRMFSQVRTRSIVASTIERCESEAKRMAIELAKRYQESRRSLYSPLHPSLMSDPELQDALDPRQPRSSEDRH